MKSALLFILIVLGVYPVCKNGELCFAGTETACAQNTSHTLMRYLEKKDGSKYYYLTVPHNCQCAVAQFTTSGEFVQYFYATLDYYKTNIEFQKFIDSAGMDNPFFPPVKIEITKTKTKKSVKQPKEKKEAGWSLLFILLLFDPFFNCVVHRRLRLSVLFKSACQ